MSGFGLDRTLLGSKIFQHGILKTNIGLIIHQLLESGLGSWAVHLHCFGRCQYIGLSEKALWPLSKYGIYRRRGGFQTQASWEGHGQDNSICKMGEVVETYNFYNNVPLQRVLKLNQEKF